MPDKKEESAPKKRAAPQQKFIRNVRYVPVSIRLDTGRKIDLKPRGYRGDCVPVNKTEMQDDKFVGNMGILFEVIPASEAKEVISKQTTNQQSVHPALNQIRNAYGEPYERGVVVEENFDDQSQTVGVISDRGQITRFKAPGTVDQPLPDIPSDVPPEEASDWLARNAKVEGPEAGIAGLKVIKEQPQKGN